ncbi:MAG: hypothetical protein EXS30_03215 [Pedosphaera sp.]|nr:hypothetical protein [Pedosphaera sp.]
MTSKKLMLLILLLAFVPAVANARIVINEIFYHAPEDVEDLEYIELYNSGEEQVDLGGWGFKKGIKFEFAPGTIIEAKGFLVICRNGDRFKEFYDAPITGVFSLALSNKGERLELLHPSGRVIDAVKYRDSAPWPMGADGFSGSLERISPEAGSDDVSNWASSPLSSDRIKPAGTPGKVNANFSASLPPVVSNVKFVPENPAPDQPIVIEADVRGETGVSEVNVLYRLAGPGFEKPELSVAMKKITESRYSAAIPGQTKDQLIRFRIQAVSPTGARRYFPAESEPRPALSSYVHGPIESAKIPFGWIIDTSERGPQAAPQRRGPQGRGGFEGPGAVNPQEAARGQARTLLQNSIDLPSAWFELTVNRQIGFATAQALRSVFSAKLSARDKMIDETLEASNVESKLKTLPDVIKTFQKSLTEALKPHLTDEQNQAFTQWQSKPQQPDSARTGMLFANPVAIVGSWVKLEGAWYAVSVKAEIDEARFDGLRKTLQELAKERNELTQQTAAIKQPEDGLRELRERGDALSEKLVATVKPILSPAQKKQFEDWQNPRNSFSGPAGGFGGGPGGFPGGRGGFGGRGGPGGFRRGLAGVTPSQSAFVYFDPATQKLELFDFVQVIPRSGGQKVHLYKDKPLNKMVGINLIFETETGVLVEPLAYEVYRKAGMAAEQSYHVRLWQNGQPAGFYLLVEQPNRAFLRRNKIPDDGNLYKILWYEQGVVGQHEKKTHVREGHDDVVALIDGLNKTQGDEQWELIKKNFDVEQVVNYFAVNTVLSHWDGFFNNYYAYHDVKGTGKWTMYPWDQDNTWGLSGMRGGSQVFFNMAITFGMNGDTPPGQRGGAGGRGGGFGFGGGGGMQWRAPGYFSGPLLANPQFRKLFLARTKEILETIYTEEIFVPIINALGERLKPEAAIRAELFKINPEREVQNLEQHLQSLRDHVKKRREFLLAQDEVKNAGKFSTADFVTPAVKSSPARKRQ